MILSSFANSLTFRVVSANAYRIKIRLESASAKHDTSSGKRSEEIRNMPHKAKPIIKPVKGQEIEEQNLGRGGG